jgi:hypothetical protein
MQLSRFILIVVLILYSCIAGAQGNYQGNGLLKLIGITEGSDQFKEALDSLGPFELEEYPGGMMKKFRNEINGVTFTLLHRQRTHSTGKTFHLDELEITLNQIGNGFKDLLPLDIFTIIGFKDQHQILSARPNITVHKKKSRKGHLNFEYSEYQNARLDGNIQCDLSYIDDVLFMMIIGH